MNRRASRVALAFLAAALLVQIRANADDAAIAARLDAVLKTPGFENGHWGVLVVDAKTGKPVYARNPDELFCPASVTKLFTTAAALADLGPDYRFQTPVHHTGKIEDGILKGDLVLVASGDPSLGGRTGPDGTMQFTDDDHSYAGGNLSSALVMADPLAGLDFLAGKVKQSGVSSISGDVIVDDRLFDRSPSSGSGPSWVSPIVVNDNVIDVVVSPGAKVGDPATFRLVPETSFVTADARVETVAAGSNPSVEVRTVGPRRFTVRGQLPVGHREVVKIYEVDEPAAFARALLIECLRRRGVRVDASPLGLNAADSLRARDEVAKLPKLAEFTSPPFKETVKVVLKVSQNLHASTLPLILAARQSKRTLPDGLRREGELLKALGVPVATISFGGGAGGSRSDLVTPRATVALLQAMAGRPDFSAYEAALPILGRDGTLARHVGPESPARGHVRAKTGSYWVDNDLTGKSVLTSKALAGYMETASGRSLIFAMFVNNVALDAPSNDVSAASLAAGQLLGKVCETLHTDGPAPTPTAAPAAATTGQAAAAQSSPPETRDHDGS